MDHDRNSIGGAWGAILRAVAWVRGVFGGHTVEQPAFVHSCYEEE